MFMLEYMYSLQLRSCIKAWKISLMEASCKLTFCVLLLNQVRAAKGRAWFLEIVSSANVGVCVCVCVCVHPPGH